MATWGLAALLSAFGYSAPRETQVLAHYMPWYEAPPASPGWGWHWTMNAFDPDASEPEGREFASHFTPLIGLYDSSDTDVLEYHLLTMKAAGIDGVIIDWYGREDFRDYAILHRNTQLLVEQVNRLGMTFAICYEDQTIPALVEAGYIDAKDRVAHARSEIEWMAENWFEMPSYARLGGAPVLLSFGQTGLSEREWKDCLDAVDMKIAYFSEHHRRSSAIGAFDWPIPSQGVAAARRFQRASKSWPQAIPAAYPRFVDIYEEAEVHSSWGRIDDADGAVFRETLDLAFEENAPIVQLVTWNDWGEGTMIEPSEEFGFRDLELVQAKRRAEAEGDFEYGVDDLRLPLRLLKARRGSDGSGVDDGLDAVAILLSRGEFSEAREKLSAIERSLSAN